MSRASSGAATPAATAATPAPPSFGTVGSAGSAFTAASGASSGMLPELAAHVARQDAHLSTGSPPGSRGGGLPGYHPASSACGGYHLGAPSLAFAEKSMLSSSGLSDALRAWLVDVEEVTFLRHPNGALQELGQGASSVVYRCLFRGEMVAAKQLNLGRSAEDQKAFLAEAERLHELRHAHIVSLYGICLSGPMGLLLMEYCGGRDLYSCLQLKKAGSQQRLFDWYGRGRHVALDCAKVLNYLHAKGVVHFDVKSSNVLLTGSGSAKLADVGLSRMSRSTHFSAFSAAIGTFAWMAPEILMSQRCSSAVDIFSLGVVLWEIVTGERPRRGSMRLPNVPDECPQEVANLITQCMTLDPTQRPTTQRVMQRLQEHTNKD